MLDKYTDVFSKGGTDLGCTGVAKHCIHTGDSASIRHGPRRVAQARCQEMEQAVSELLAQRVVEGSTSPWSSALVLVKKKVGTTRFYVDYRALNSITIPPALGE